MAAWALDPDVRLQDFNHVMWTSKDGAPAEITSMAQTKDGWLWLGTPSGLYRFDGMRFELYQPPAGSSLLNSRISELAAQDNGELWIGYVRGGLSVLRQNGKLEHLALQDKDNLLGGTYTLALDTDGSAWIANGRGLMHFSAGKWRRVGEESGFPGVRAINVLLDQYGQLWASNGEKLYLLDRASGKFRPGGVEGISWGLIQSPDGRLWSAERDKLRLVPSPAAGPTLPRKPGFNQIEGHGTAIFDSDGNLWSLKCPRGLCFVPRAGDSPATQLLPSELATDKFDQPWQMTTLTTNLLLEDREGNIWVATQAGLERFRNNKLIPARIPGSDGFLSMASDADGKVWIADQLTGKAWNLPMSGTPPTELPLKIYTVTNDINGALLLAGPRGIERRRSGETKDEIQDKTQMTPLPERSDGKTVDEVVSRLYDDGVNLWVTLKTRGSFVRRNEHWSSFKEAGLPDGLTLAAVAGKGQIWLGFNDGSLIFYDNGNLMKYAAADMLGIGAITGVQAGQQIIVAGEKGIVTLRQGRFFRLQLDSPDVLRNVTGLVTTSNGDHWFNGARGVVHILQADWKRAMENPSSPLRYELIDVLEGYPGEAATGTWMSTTFVNRDGQLWFAATGGIVRLDPAKQRPQARIPKVEIRSVNTEQQRYAASEDILLPAGTSNFHIEYTTLSYAKPEQVRFRYWLEGADRSWKEAGARRAAYFTNLGPGTYHFNVMASGEDGMWDTGTSTISSVSFRIAPTMVQTAWFKALCAIAVLLVLWWLYRLRLRQVTRLFDIKHKERLAERERISRELHDTLLQSVQGLVLKIHGAVRRLPQQEPMREVIEGALNNADNIIVEARDRVSSLRSVKNCPDLASALDKVGQSLVQGSSIQFDIGILGEARTLHPVIRDEVYWIAREALINAFNHAQATRIDIGITYTSREMRLSIRDNGRGIPDETLRYAAARSHWGIVGMQERAAKINAVLRYQSPDKTGTEWTIVLPGRIAYEGNEGHTVWQRLLKRA
ncbi:histidine kinase [Undibacterium terreum]|uniref:Histidine kinase n=2 Tax=Undibacterium terreum TaxID=1224302 RepID=A0A916UBE5_9BURK|nr:histidine kinase [Undibacterium terreum]